MTNKSQTKSLDAGGPRQSRVKIIAASAVALIVVAIAVFIVSLPM